MPNNEFPKYLYHATKGDVLVKDAEQQASMGEGWNEEPASAPAAVEVAPECPNCISMRAQFDKAYTGLIGEKNIVEKDLSAAMETEKALRADLEEVRAQLAEATLALNAAKAEEKPKAKK